MRGPGMKPELMLSRRSTARNGCEPTSRTVVNPASRVFLALTTPVDGGVEGRAFEVPDGIVAVGAGSEMGMAVDEAGKDVRLG